MQNKEKKTNKEEEKMIFQDQFQTNLDQKSEFGSKRSNDFAAYVFLKSSCSDSYNRSAVILYI